jgi:hypothetical protein
MLARPKLLAVMLIAFPLAGCSTSGAGIADASCDAFKPITMSKQDTEPTRRQIVGHNRAFDAICKKTS